MAGMPPESNPFAVLSLIVAPAILTNASSLLAMSTSNRLARAVDRARDLLKQLEQSQDYSSPVAERRLRELTAAEQRSAMLVAALQRFYMAMGGFSLAALVALMGAVLAGVGSSALVLGFELAGVAAGLVAVGSLVHGAVTLVRETRIALAVVRERAAQIQSRVADYIDSRPGL
jgi:hypothetical protein